MMYAKIRRADNGYVEEHIYLTADEYIRDTCSPETEVLSLLPFRVTGSSYAERKESARNLAIEFQFSCDGDSDIQLSHGEWLYVGNWFQRAGKRYGLLREYRENAVC